MREDTESWRLRDGALELRAQKGRIWAGDDARNLLVLQRSIEGASAAIDVDLGKPKTKWEQGGLLVYRDHNHFAKLVVEHIDGAYFVVLAREFGKPRRVFSKIGIPSGKARLRLTVKDNVVTASFRLGDAGEWKPAAKCEFPDAAKAKFALFTQDGSDEEIRFMRFDNFSYETGAGKRE